jgi:hypothetical protein
MIEIVNNAIPEFRPLPTKGNWLKRLITKKRWELTKNISIKIFLWKITIPKGTITDFASVPRILKWLLPDDAIYSIASVVHDYLYHTHKTSKWLADAFFYEILKMEKIRKPIAFIMWLAVFLFGYFAWANGYKTNKDNNNNNNNEKGKILWH